MSQCHFLSEYCVPTSFSMRFSIVIHLTICSHEYKVWDHHKIQTQTIHREWIITFLINTEEHDNIDIHIMKYNLFQHSSRHSTTYHITSHLNTTSLTHYHIIHILKDPNTISLNQSISINTQTNILTCRLYLWTVQNTWHLNCSQNNFNSSRLKVIKLIGLSQWISSQYSSHINLSSLEGLIVMWLYDS